MSKPYFHPILAEVYTFDLLFEIGCGFTLSDS